MSKFEGLSRGAVAFKHALLLMDLEAFVGHCLATPQASQLQRWILQSPKKMSELDTHEALLHS